MSLPHALLTALIERPHSSGLELARRFDKSIGHFWQASHQQIYRELGRLEADGLIASEAEAEARGRKRNYHVLPAGEAALRDWLGEADASTPLRDTLMVKLRADAVLGPERSDTPALIAAIEDRLTQHRDKLAQYESFAVRDMAHPDPDRAVRIRQLILQAGLRHESGWVETLEQALERLKVQNS
jgi:DNA-binding PadR family transcriptional regulator